MTQSIAIMVLGSPYANSSTHTALDFARQVLAAGHRIELLFFYHEAAQVGSCLSVSAQDEQNLPGDWQLFIQSHQIPAIVCIASGLKRGIIDQPEAKRFYKPQYSLNENIKLGGLGQWIEAIGNADKQIIFGA